MNRACESEYTGVFIDIPAVYKAREVEDWSIKMGRRNRSGDINGTTAMKHFPLKRSSPPKPPSIRTTAAFYKQEESSIHRRAPQLRIKHLH